MTIWMSGVLATADAAEPTLRAHHGARVEVIGLTRQGPTRRSIVETFDVIVVGEGVLLTVGTDQVRRMRTEGAG